MAHNLIQAIYEAINSAHLKLPPASDLYLLWSNLHPMSQHFEILEVLHIL